MQNLCQTRALPGPMCAIILLTRLPCWLRRGWGELFLVLTVTSFVLTPSAGLFACQPGPAPKNMHVRVPILFDGVCLVCTDPDDEPFAVCWDREVRPRSLQLAALPA